MKTTSYATDSMSNDPTPVNAAPLCHIVIATSTSSPPSLCRFIIYSVQASHRTRSPFAPPQRLTPFRLFLRLQPLSSPLINNKPNSHQTPHLFSSCLSIDKTRLSSLNRDSLNPLPAHIVRTTFTLGVPAERVASLHLQCPASRILKRTRQGGAASQKTTQQADAENRARRSRRRRR